MTDSPPQSAVEPDLDLARAAKIGPFSHLIATRLLELSCAFVPETAIPPQPYTITLEVGFGWARRDDGFSYFFKADVKVSPDNKADDPFWSCVVAQDVTYQVEDPARFDDEDVVAFGMTSGLLAAWPYVREAVQSMSLRAGLGPVVLDVMRIPQAAPSGEQSE